jgi:glycerate 2-kinase
MLSSSHERAALRVAAREIFLHALKQTSVDSAFERHVHYSRGVLRVSDDLFHLSSYSRIFVVALGKAAHTMANALVHQLGTLASGIIAAPAESIHGAPQLAGFRYFAGGHPYPNAESIRAAAAILKSLRSLARDSFVIYLISGGGSSVVEKPVDDEISLDDVVATYRVLVGSGAPIAEINAIRKHLSQVKGGRMAEAVASSTGAPQISIMISDVPADSLDSLASGPTMPDSSYVEDCERIAAQYQMLEKFPASVRELFQRHAVSETPKKDDPLFHRSRWWPILSNETAVKAAALKASEHRFAVEVDNSCDDWDYQKAGDYLLRRLRELREGASRVCLVSGGEVTVTLGAEPGIGGRNQQFAAYCATKIKNENITVLSAGTDGIDGNSPAAGAVVDGDTLTRYPELLKSPNAQEHSSSRATSLESALQNFDTYPVFNALGDAIITGPTGNNIRDLRILMA